MRAAVEGTHQAISHMGMEVLAVVRQVLIVLVVRHGNERAHVGDAHRDQALLKRIVQLAAQPAVAR